MKYFHFSLLLESLAAKQGNIRQSPINLCGLLSSKQNSSSCPSETTKPKQCCPKLPGNPSVSSSLACLKKKHCSHTVSKISSQIMQLVCVRWIPQSSEIFVRLSSLNEEMPQRLQGVRHFPLQLCFYSTLIFTDSAAKVEITKREECS